MASVEFRLEVPRWPSRWRSTKPLFELDENGCWIWQRAVDGVGYGKVARVVAGKMRWFGAHVLFWQMFRGPIPVGQEPDHTCRVRCCVNPYHLELVTRSENLRRGWRHGGRQRREREAANRSAGQFRRWRGRRAG